MEVKIKKSPDGLSLFLCLFLMIIQGCGQTNNNNAKLETYDRYRTQQLETRDSLFILHTVKEWSKLNWYTFEDYSKMYKMTNEQVKYFIGGTFYSPDKKKILVWIGEKVPNAETITIYNKNKSEVNKLCPNGADTIYNLSALIGIRDSVNQIWKLYPFNQQAAGCFSSKEEAINVLGQYYFEKMKTHSVDVSKQFLNKQYGGKVRYDLENKTIDLGYGDSDSPLISKNLGYNLQDKSFWNMSLIWQKGATVEGYYDFQLHGMDLFKIPEVTYPEEILKLYK